MAKSQFPQCPQPRRPAAEDRGFGWSVAETTAADVLLLLFGAVLVPIGHRERTRALLNELGRMLRWWMVGQLISMTAVGLLSYVGLRLLGVPLALILAVVAFFLTFIPFIGPLLSAIPSSWWRSAQAPPRRCTLYSCTRRFRCWRATC